MISQANTLRISMAALYLLTFLVSGWLTINLWRSGSGQNEDFAVGVTLHIALYIFAAAARGLPLERHIKATTWILVAMLWLLSVAATIGHLNSKYRTSEVITTQAIIELEHANRATEIRLKNAEIFSRYDKATKSTAQLKPQESSENLTRLIVQQGQINHLVNIISESLNTNKDTTKLTLFALLAILLDASGIVAAILLFQPVQQLNPLASGGTTVEQQAIPLKDTIRTAILSGDLSDRPSVTKIQSAFGAGRGTVSRILNELNTEGVVTKDERGYKRANQ
ncbi:MAG: hypothetical protein ACRBBW_03945 [Cellvibrionaceae bacterium]